MCDQTLSSIDNTGDYIEVHRVVSLGDMTPPVFLLSCRIMVTENGDVRAGRLRWIQPDAGQFTRMGNLADGNNIGNKDGDQNLIIQQPANRFIWKSE